MPLAFGSLSHGTIAFGYFNVDSDMLLLDRLFFFTPEFCDAAILVRTAAGPATAEIPGWRIDDPAAIGDLHAAIAGTALVGFIGSVYARFPFPASPEGFRQSPEGSASRGFVASEAARFGEPLAIPVVSSPGRVSIGDYEFTGAGWDALVAYVAVGGMPRWRDGRRAACVERMVRLIGPGPTR